MQLNLKYICIGVGVLATTGLVAYAQLIPSQSHQREASELRAQADSSPEDAPVATAKKISNRRGSFTGPSPAVLVEQASDDFVENASDANSISNHNYRDRNGWDWSKHEQYLGFSPEELQQLANEGDIYALLALSVFEARNGNAIYGWDLRMQAAARGSSRALAEAVSIMQVALTSLRKEHDFPVDAITSQFRILWEGETLEESVEVSALAFTAAIALRGDPITAEQKLRSLVWESGGAGTITKPEIETAVYLGRKVIAWLDREREQWMLNPLGVDVNPRLGSTEEISEAMVVERLWRAAEQQQAKLASGS